MKEPGDFWKRVTINIFLAIFCIMGMHPNVSIADIYGYQDPDGNWHFPSIDGSKKKPGAKFKDHLPITYDILIKKASEFYHVDACLVKAIIRAESDFDQGAISPKGAMGLMQLMPGTASQMNVCNTFSAKENIFGGVRYLAQLLERFDNNVILAIAAYNAGPSRVVAHGKVPSIPETQDFVKKVLRYYYLYKYQDHRTVLSVK